jgi:hypothetical protein
MADCPSPLSAFSRTMVRNHLLRIRYLTGSGCDSNESRFSRSWAAKNLLNRFTVISVLIFFPATDLEKSPVQMPLNIVKSLITIKI